MASDSTKSQRCQSIYETSDERVPIGRSNVNDVMPQQLSISGIFEGTAEGASGRNLPDISGGGEGASPFHPTTREAFEYFSDKAIKINDVNQRLRDDKRLVFARGAESSSRMGSQDSDSKAAVLARASTSKQLDVLPASRKGVELETPVEKVQRLQGEVTDMINFITSFTDDTKTKHIENLSDLLQAADADEARDFFGADPECLSAELKTLQTSLEGISSCEALRVDMNGSKDLGPQPGNAGLAVRGEGIRYVTEQLERISNKIAGGGGDEKTKLLEEQRQKDAIPEGFTYELFAFPDAHDVWKVGRLVELEKRLAELESSLGVSKASSLPSKDLNTGDCLLHHSSTETQLLDIYNLINSHMSSALKDVAVRLSLLHPSRVDALSKRLSALLTQIDDVLYKKERIVSSQLITGGQQQQSLGTSETAVQELYEFYEGTRPIASALPVVVNRLKLLKTFHQDAASVSTRLSGVYTSEATYKILCSSALEAHQEELSNLLTTTETQVKLLRESVNINISWAKEIVVNMVESPKP